MDQVIREILLYELRRLEKNELGLSRREEEVKSELNRVQSELKELREKMRVVNKELVNSELEQHNL